MLTSKSILILMALHFLADQVLQLKSVQVVKNKSTLMLLAHISTWGLFIFLFGCYAASLTGNLHLALSWPLSLMVIHFGSEWILGRLYTHFYHNNQLRMLLLVFFFENLIVMASMVILFDYFL